MSRNIVMPGLRGLGAPPRTQHKGSQIAADLPNDVSGNIGLLWQREQAILDLVRAGNFHLTWVPLTVERGGHRATFWVTADALRLGVKGDSFRVAVTAKTEQRIADELHAVMPTPFLSDEIYRQSHIKLIPRPQGTERMGSMTQMLKHHNAVEAQLPQGVDLDYTLIAPVGKDWVNSRRLLGNPTVQGDKAAVNYGWQRTDLHPTPKIGPFPAATGYPPLVVHQSEGMRHGYSHQDYSQVVRLINRAVMVCRPLAAGEPSVASGFGSGPLPGWCVPNAGCMLPNGQRGVTQCMDIYDIARDPQLNVLVSHNGPVYMRHFAVPYEHPVGSHPLWEGTEHSTPAPPPNPFVDMPPAGDFPAGPPYLHDYGALSARVGARVISFAAGVGLGWIMLRALKR